MLVEIYTDRGSVKGYESDKGSIIVKSHRSSYTDWVLSIHDLSIHSEFLCSKSHTKAEVEDLILKRLQKAFDGLKRITSEL